MIVGTDVSKRGVPLATEYRAGTQTASTSYSGPSGSGTIVAASGNILRIFSITIAINGDPAVTDAPVQINLQDASTAFVLGRPRLTAGFQVLHLDFPLGIELPASQDLTFSASKFGGTKIAGSISASFTRTP